MDLLLALCLWVLQPATVLCRSVGNNATHLPSSLSKSDAESWEDLSPERLSSSNIAELLIPIIERGLSKEHRPLKSKKVIQILPVNESKESWPHLSSRKKHVVEITPLRTKGPDGKPLAYILSPAKNNLKRDRDRNKKRRNKNREYTDNIKDFVLSKLPKDMSQEKKSNIATNESERHSKPPVNATERQQLIHEDLESSSEHITPQPNESSDSSEFTVTFSSPTPSSNENKSDSDSGSTVSYESSTEKIRNLSSENQDSDANKSESSEEPTSDKDSSSFEDSEDSTVESGRIPSEDFSDILLENSDSRAHIENEGPNSSEEHNSSNIEKHHSKVQSEESVKSLHPNIKKHAKEEFAQDSNKMVPNIIDNESHSYQNYDDSKITNDYDSGLLLKHSHFSEKINEKHHPIPLVESSTKKHRTENSLLNDNYDDSDYMGETDVQEDSDENEVETLSQHIPNEGSQYNTNHIGYNINENHKTQHDHHADPYEHHKKHPQTANHENKKSNADNDVYKEFGDSHLDSLTLKHINENSEDMSPFRRMDSEQNQYAYSETEQSHEYKPDKKHKTSISPDKSNDLIDSNNDDNLDEEVEGKTENYSEIQIDDEEYEYIKDDNTNNGEINENNGQFKENFNEDNENKIKSTKTGRKQYYPIELETDPIDAYYSRQKNSKENNDEQNKEDSANDDLTETRLSAAQAPTFHHNFKSIDELGRNSPSLSPGHVDDVIFNAHALHRRKMIQAVSTSRETPEKSALQCHYRITEDNNDRIHQNKSYKLSFLFYK